MLKHIAAGWLIALAASPARAAFLSGEALDTAADILAIVVIFLVPAVAIVVFWIVHVLPEKIAHKRHHPQTEAITTLCLLSLVFGGLLWPLAWIWAYTKPVAYRVAYGTDKHELVLYSGDRAVFERSAPILRSLRGDADLLGDDPGLAALHDLGMLDIFFNGMAAFLHAAAL